MVEQLLSDPMDVILPLMYAGNISKNFSASYTGDRFEIRERDK